jgi:16S rRNA (cytosine967-C5)-methyltransferase
LPDWLVARLAQRMSAEALLALARALNTPAPLDLRVNTCEGGTGGGGRAPGRRRHRRRRPAAFAPIGLRLKGKPYLQKHPAYLDGSIEVQDEGSQLLGHSCWRPSAARWWWISVPAPAARP